MSWDAPFSEPVPVAGKKPLVTLRDAAQMIQNLPKAVVDQPAWQTALSVLMQAADNGGPIDFARIGMMKALHPVESVYDPSRKDPKWGRRKLARDQ